MDQEPLGNLGIAPQRRLSDLIAQAFFQARDQGDVVTGGHLLAALESLTKREAELYPDDRRFRIDSPARTTVPALMDERQISLSTIEVCYDLGLPPQGIVQPTKTEDQQRPSSPPTSSDRLHGSVALSRTDTAQTHITTKRTLVRERH